MISKLTLLVDAWDRYASERGELKHRLQGVLFGL